MRKKVKMLAAIVCAAAWWSVFYPELCFTEETCQVIQGTETDTAAGIMQAEEDEVVISSRFLEWCEENLFDKKE